MTFSEAKQKADSINTQSTGFVASVRKSVYGGARIETATVEATVIRNAMLMALHKRDGFIKKY